jgi:hypothetical protein
VITSLLLLTSALIVPRADALDRFVVVTDSHGVCAYGSELAGWLRKRQATQFDFFASGASAPLQWINNAFTTPCGFHDKSSSGNPEPRECRKLHTPRLSDLWKEQPQRVDGERRISIISLGTNFGMSAGMKDEQLAATRRLIEEAMKASDRCIWVGPPNMTRKNGFDTAGVEYKYSLIRKAIEQAAHATGKPSCQLIDSRQYSKYPEKCGDGIHYHFHPKCSEKGIMAECAKAAREWADGVVAQADCLLAGSEGSSAGPSACVKE